MKILFIIHNISLCGAERVLSIIANELASRDYQVYVLTDPHNISYDIDKRITIIDAYSGIDISIKKNFLGSAFRYLKLMFRQYFLIKHVIKEINPEIVVSFMGMCIWQLLPFRKMCRIIISDHSAMDREFTYKMNYERRSLPEYFYCQTVLTQVDKLFLGKKRSNVVVVGDPLTFPVITTSEYNELFPKRKGILACGSLERYHIKGIDTLIKAFSIAVKDKPDWILEIAGAGSAETLKELAAKEGVSKQVFFLGFRDDMDSLMKTHSLFVHAPRSEGFGMVLTEAMACGCPIVSSALSGPTEIICDNKDGVLVESQNINALATAIVDMMTNSSKRYSMGLEALKSVQRFSTSAIVDKWESLFKEDSLPMN